MARRRILLAVLVWLAAGAAEAAPRACEGHANGADSARMVVVFEKDGGQITKSQAIWSPPRSGTDAFPMLHVSYDLSSGALGAAQSLKVAGFVKFDPAPKSSTARVVVKLNDGGSWARQWELFARHMATRKQAGAPTADPKNGRALGFFGGTPMAFRQSSGESLNPDLLDRLANARSAEVQIEGDAGEVLERRRFDLSASEQRDALLHDAWAKAAEAAKSAGGCTPVRD